MKNRFGYKEYEVWSKGVCKTYHHNDREQALADYKKSEKPRYLYGIEAFTGCKHLIYSAN